jgi:hypothetical protein
LFIVAHLQNREIHHHHFVKVNNNKKKGVSDQKVCDLLGTEFATSLPHKLHKGNSKAELWACSNTSLRVLQKRGEILQPPTN